MRYIAVTREAPLNASRWLGRVLQAVRDLSVMPSRHNLAPESAFKTYEVRRVIVDSHYILFTVDESAHKVWVIGFRYGGSLPRPDDLPDKLA